MTHLTFTVQFHQPFLVRSGLARGGLDAVARAGTALPASSLKGAMRASCLQVLGAPEAVVAEIFGREGNNRGAWAWTDAGPDTAFTRFSRARNRIDPVAGVVRPEALTFTEECWQAGPASFHVEQVEPLEGQVRERHTTVLVASVWGVTALGSWRNRSMGAVTIRPCAPISDLAAKLEKVIAS